VHSLERITEIPDITMIYGSHNTLGIAPNILEEVKAAVTYLREQNLMKFGTGLHKFNGFSVKF
ncbi:MAG TPA: MBL fold metallo-hydrolase, partial [Bacillaceae bacterium]